MAFVCAFKWQATTELARMGLNDAHGFTLVTQGAFVHPWRDSVQKNSQKKKKAAKKLFWRTTKSSVWDIF